MMNLSAEYLRIILDRIKDAVIIIDEQGRIIRVNRKAESLLNLKKSNYQNKSIEAVIEGSQLLRVIKTGSEEINVPFSYQNRDYLVDRLPVIIDHKVCGALALFHDVTYLLEVKKKLKDDEHYIETLDTIVDACGEQIVLIDEKGMVKFMSESYKNFLGINEAEGKHVTEVIENTRLHLVLESGQTEVGDLQMIHGHKVVTMRMPIIKDDQVIGAVGKVMFKDVGELNKLSEQSNLLARELSFEGHLLKERTAKFSFDSIIGHSKAIQDLIRMAQKVAKTDSNVLITGESGTGKEVFVHAIHDASLRRHKPFVKINCAAIPGELLESELFGYTDGAFTGAKRGGKLGKIQLAHKGTLLLDEIGDMPLEMQAKLLRVIQEKELEKVGGEGTEKVDVRIVASTHRDLSQMVKNNEFRQDLYYRLDVINLELPPLRKRREDILPLAKELSYTIGQRIGIFANHISRDVKDIFMAYEWPGNIRELENVLERAMNLIDVDGVIKKEHLPDHMKKLKRQNKYLHLKDDNDFDLKKQVEDLEKTIIATCLKKVAYNKNQASKMLNISRVSLYKKIEKYNL